MDSRAEFIRQPAVFSDKWQSGAIFYFVLQHLNEFDRLNSALFNVIHKQGIEFSSQQDFVTWLTLNGVEEEKANEAFESFTVAVNVNKAKSNTYKYRVNGVPVVIVNGKYWVDASHAGSEQRIFEVVDHLIQKESQ